MNFVETRLAKLARNGDRAAFTELVELYKDKIFHLAYRMLNNKQEAQDAVQETFLRVYMNLHRYDDKQKLSTWIFRIGTNHCIDLLRKRKNRTYSLDAEIPDGEGNDFYSMLQSYEPTPENQVIVSETQMQIRRAIDSLSEKYKTVVILRYLHDMSLQEISEILDMPVTTVKTRVHRGRAYLKLKLEQEPDLQDA
ncbi:RNA polymerase sigma factor SigW [Paenibacillus eucommiae]|uniref:RNA polymerase sigma-70 factor (ECF subfamily) n=1 Tax=Paenibacillus eucommiae TaxID=1355755 RepID=A0ABS4JAE9_9BACL|nr:RNA polymerase sigma factor SigW [Paenibacillus eucommiae]MBP1996822.1 RNA polymerase sigma-70 factor (ECF subfamily) [Paenibacillus eucommiae]